MLRLAAESSESPANSTATTLSSCSTALPEAPWPLGNDASNTPLSMFPSAEQVTVGGESGGMKLSRFGLVQPGHDVKFAAWPEVDLRITPDAGHSAFEPANVHELVMATDRFAG